MSFTILRIIELLIVIPLSGFLLLNWWTWNKKEMIPQRVSYMREKLNQLNLALIGFVSLTVTSVIHFYFYVDQLTLGFMMMEPFEAFWRVGTTTLFGVISWLRPLLLVLLVVVILITKKRRVLKSFILLLLLLSFSYSGHAYYYDMTIVHLGHLLAVTVWFTGLTQLAVMSSLIDSDKSLTWYGRQLKHFSAAAGFAVFVLAVSGLLLAIVYIQSLDLLFTTYYGQAIIWKTAIFFVALLFAVGHRFYLLKRLEQYLDGRRRFKYQYLFWSIRVECMIVVIIIILAGVISTSPPPTDIPYDHH